MHLNQLTEMLRLDKSEIVFSVRDLAKRKEIAAVSQQTNKLAREFFDADVDEHFKSTIVEARLFMALYRNFEQEIEDTFLKSTFIKELTN